LGGKAIGKYKGKAHEIVKYLQRQYETLSSFYTNESLLIYLLDNFKDNFRSIE
jgi:hypothetical protein